MSFIDPLISTKQGRYCLLRIIIISLALSASCLSAESITFQAARGQVSSSQNTTATTNGGEFLTYTNPTSGVRIQFPKDWSVTEGGNSPLGANYTIVIFKSPSKTSSELGNISGMSGRFVPYLGIFAFNSKNMSLPQIMNKVIRGFHNSAFVLLSTPISLHIC